MRTVLLRLKREEMQGGPLLDKGLRGWLVNTARENFWRVARWYEFNDLLQDGLLCYVRCLRRYSFLDEANPTAEERKWFMALVCTSYIRHIHDLANKSSLCAEVLLASEAEFLDETKLLDIPDNSIFHPVCMSLLAEAPPVIRRLVVGLVSEVTGNAWRATVRLTGTTPRVHYGKRPVRETLNQYYCRLAGVDPEQTDLRGLVTTYFGV